MLALPITTGAHIYIHNISLTLFCLRLALTRSRFLSFSVFLCACVSQNSMYSIRLAAQHCVCVRVCVRARSRGVMGAGLFGESYSERLFLTFMFIVRVETLNINHGRIQAMLTYQQGSAAVASSALMKVTSISFRISHSPRLKLSVSVSL